MFGWSPDQLAEHEMLVGRPAGYMMLVWELTCATLLRGLEASNFTLTIHLACAKDGNRPRRGDPVQPVPNKVSCGQPDPAGGAPKK